jgi:hypothetical protein
LGNAIKTRRDETERSITKLKNAIKNVGCPGGTFVKIITAGLSCAFKKTSHLESKLGDARDTLKLI